MKESFVKIEMNGVGFGGEPISYPNNYFPQQEFPGNQLGLNDAAMILPLYGNFFGSFPNSMVLYQESPKAVDVATNLPYDSHVSVNQPAELLVETATDCDGPVKKEEDSADEWRPAKNQSAGNSSQRTAKRERKPTQAIDSIKEEDPAATLNSPSTYRGLFGLIKYTNMPKKLIKLFKTSLSWKLRILRYRHKLENSSSDPPLEVSEQQRFLRSTLLRVSRKKVEEANIKDLLDLFQGH